MSVHTARERVTESPRVVCSSTVNVGGYIQAVLDRNLAENISRVLYPNDNVRSRIPPDYVPVAAVT